MRRASIPTLGHPSRTAAVVALKAEGYSTRTIADQIGVSTATVAALLCSERKRKHRPSEDGLRTVTFPVDVLEALRPHAARRGVHANELARRLVEAAVDADLIDAVLDDGS